MDPLLFAVPVAFGPLLAAPLIAHPLELEAGRGERTAAPITADNTTAMA
ncbi:hypothetical protein [Rhodococcus chondri]|uniref:Uncharacterized protein n=1 Tax=Rhodococcus chondri TaxID=3065941 RepID=A0ABU7JPZ5_9NOCA|nr:hypothetical protein [Rhodococcus sp. CC-R104]MEE2031885.1 hypothetical protein [Rhodococcus sp. CC-R104]